MKKLLFYLFLVYIIVLEKLNKCLTKTFLLMREVRPAQWLVWMAAVY